MTTRNNQLSTLIDRVISIMVQNNCRVMDSDIVKALMRAKYDIEGGYITTIHLDTTQLIKNI